MRNAGLEETQAGIKIAGRNINNLTYADDTTLMAENEEELKSLVMKVKEEIEKVGLKLNIQKMKIMASGPISSWTGDLPDAGIESTSPALLASHFITTEPPGKPRYSLVICRGPAPADPGYSKERRHRRGSGNNCLIKC